ncbi:MAG: rhomboid family intramembrane serine protease [Polaribacter sp.]|jgi:membrane associated rhomboid family serine protease|nr:rhomboid family intramembrane serine protease [Polaribacter sp.]MDA9234524.1 rhomboid family intramembrane serine protease [Polaribacter sp.]MDA9245197.1 rhomboid family intramembrane serine protease [Polaribacter sp.]MDA9348197.1 rhomboid family intramembrane serine protease [Polaribacter sp.]MDB0025920.1 rhomboid family intramembrane serine protease [Polaribacter sp.]
MGNITETIKHLIILNVILFVVPQFLNLDLTNILALHFPQNEHFGFWQYLTSTFMHGSFGHILFNMYGLYAFGTPLEQMWGKKKFLFFYFSTGIGASIIYTLVNYYQFNDAFEKLIELGATKMEIMKLMNPTLIYNDEILQTVNALYNTSALGASGAVYGVLVAFGLYFKEAKLAMIFFPIPIAAKYFIPILLLGDLFFGMTRYSVGNIAHFAHIGGALVGFIIAWYWKKNQFKFS